MVGFCLMSSQQVKGVKCGQTSTEESEFLSRSCCVRTPVGIMETLCGKAIVPNAGEKRVVQQELLNRTQGKVTQIQF